MKTEEFTGRSSEMKEGALWLSVEDLLELGDIPVTIEGIFKHTDAVFDDGRKATVFSIKFSGSDKHLILNPTNRQYLVRKFGTINVQNWVGQQVFLYINPDVKFQGKITGGIRIK